MAAVWRAAMGAAPPDGPALLRRTLASLATPSDASATALHLLGDEHAHASPHRLSLAMALALLGWGQATERLGRARGLPAQHLTVSLWDAARFLFPEHTWAPRLSGRRLPLGSRDGVPLLNAILPTADGRNFVPSALAPAQVLAWAQALGCTPQADALAAAVRAHDGEALEAMADHHQLAGALCRTAAEWAACPQGQSLLSDPVWTVQPLAGARRAPAAMAADPARRALSGIRVLCFGRVFAGPIAARLLAEQGAEVLWVGPPHGGEARAVWLEGHVGGRACGLDLRHGSDRQAARRLLHECDVVIDNLRPGALSGWGLWPLSPADGPVPSLVQISAWGCRGPRQGAVGYDMNVQAATGVLAAEGGSGPPRFGPTLLVADFLAAGWAAAAAVTALLSAAPTASHISLAGSLMWLQSLGPRAPHTPQACPLPATVTVRTPWGLLRRLAPAVRFSACPSRFDAIGVPAPASSAPAWRPEHSGLACAPRGPLVDGRGADEGRAPQQLGCR